MQAVNRKQRSRFSRNAWTIAASCALTAFTVFVLLDAFVLERVQQTVQEADLSSIVAAQGQVNGAYEVGADTESSESRENGDVAADAAADSGEGASDASSDTSAKTEGSSDGRGAAGSRPSRHGKLGVRAHGKPSNSSGSGNSDSAQDASESGSRPGSSEARSGKRSSDSSSTTTDVSQVVAGAATASSVGTTIGSYSDDNMKIEVSSVRAYDTDIYVADIQVSSAEYLKTALAQNSFGRNLKDTTSNMAESAGAVLAINGDYYGFRDDGYVLRNGVLYREDASAGTDALVVYGDGSMSAVSQDEKTAQELKEAGAWQVLSFGPVLVNDGQIAVAADEEVGQSRNSNPRTAIGMISPLHYVVVVSDGRTEDNDGLSLYELSQVLVDNGATFAYNLDGGGSTTLYFKGEVLNNPTSGNVGGERSVSDIVYFG